LHVGGSVRNLVVGRDERLEREQRHEFVVVGLGGNQVGDVDPEVPKRHVCEC